MSCQDCELEPINTYVRIDNADVEIQGCEKHLKRLLELIQCGYRDEERRAKERKRWKERYNNKRYKEKYLVKSRERASKYREEHREECNEKRRRLYYAKKKAAGES